MFETKQYSWSDVTINYQGRKLVGVQGVTYKKSVERELVYGRGSNPLAVQSGNKKVEGTLMLLQSELEGLTAAIKAINPTADITDFKSDILVTYGQGNTAVTDRINGAYISEYEKGMEQNDKFKVIELPFIALSVDEKI